MAIKMYFEHLTFKVPVGQRSQTFCSEVCNEDLCNLDNCQLPGCIPLIKKLGFKLKIYFLKNSKCALIMNTNISDQKTDKNFLWYLAIWNNF
jgi:hypothetical protein